MHLDTTNHVEHVHNLQTRVYVGTIERFLRPAYIHAHDTAPNQADSYGYLATNLLGGIDRYLTAQAARGWLIDQQLRHSCDLPIAEPIA